MCIRPFILMLANVCQGYMYVYSGNLWQFIRMGERKKRGKKGRKKEKKKRGGKREEKRGNTSKKKRKTSLICFPV